jgi:hypothetical protein
MICCFAYISLNFFLPNRALLNSFLGQQTPGPWHRLLCHLTIRFTVNPARPTNRSLSTPETKRYIICSLKQKFKGDHRRSLLPPLPPSPTRKSRINNISWPAAGMGMGSLAASSISSRHYVVPGWWCATLDKDVVRLALSNRTGDHEDGDRHRVGGMDGGATPLVFHDKGLMDVADEPVMAPRLGTPHDFTKVITTILGRSHSLVLTAPTTLHRIYS